MRRVGLTLGLLALAAGAAPAHGKTARAFAVGPKFSLDWVDTREHFRDKMLALADRRLRTPPRPAVQDGADDVASHLRGGGADLVTLPEDVGLFAVFTGTKGNAARNAVDITTAIAQLLVAYGPETAYYQRKYPELAGRPLPTRSLFLAGTDVFGRVAVETFAELADRLDATVVAGVNMAQDWQIVCVSKASMPKLPGGAACAEEDASKVAQLRGPDEPERTYAYEATTSKASNMALVFDADGKLVSKQVKTYIVPTELPSQLDLVPGEVSGGITAVDTPAGRLGIVISKDAWMPDVLGKLDAAHVDTLVQPEFFIDNLVAPVGMWQPDNIKASGLSDVQRLPALRAYVHPSLTGNVYDLAADDQSKVAVRTRVPNRVHKRLVGQEPTAGLLAVASYPVAEGDGPIVERRQQIAREAVKLGPKSTTACRTSTTRGACRGGQTEDVVWADVEVGQRAPLKRARLRRRGPAPFTAARRLAPSRLAQRNLVLASHGRTVYAAFEEAGATDRVALARSTDGGKKFRRLPRAGGVGDERWPSLSVGPDGTLWLAWQSSASGVERVLWSRSTDGGATFSAAAPLDAAAGEKVRQWRPAVAATTPGRAVATWIDERGRFTVDDLPRADVFVARLGPGGPETGRRLDTSPPSDEKSATLDNDWAPHVAAHGDDVIVTWTDFRDYDWDVVARRSRDGGETFGPTQPLNDTPKSLEALDDTPRAVVTQDGPLVAWTDYRSGDPKDTSLAPHPLYDVMLAAPSGINRRVDDHGAAQVNTFWPAPASLPSGDVLVAWQDHASGPARIRVARVPRGGRGGPARRVDDLGNRAGSAWRPALTVAGARAVVGWEDDRDGPAQLFVTRAAASRIR